MTVSDKVAIIGLGYVGLPLAIALAEQNTDVLGFDINPRRIEELLEGLDNTGEIDSSRLDHACIRYSCDANELRDRNLFIVTVPTPIDAANNPDLTPIIKASETVGQYLSQGDIVVYESTVYPGVTEDICGPLLERVSGLRQGQDFKLAYSPERINPGDKVHRLETVVKVVAAEDENTLERVAQLYGSVVKAGIYRAPTIRVAEAAKVIENTQRDLNIALMNELAIIFDRLGISTRAVLEAAGTKWNFLNFTPGLVGGHCIGVDPYYLTHKAQEVGYHPEVILAGRRVNDGMGAFIAQKTVKLLIGAGLAVKGARIGILGLTFKENVPDLRNSKVPDIVKELAEFGVISLVHDPLANPREAQHEYGLELRDMSEWTNLDGVILAVAHQAYRLLEPAQFGQMVRKGGVFVDVKALFKADELEPDLHYWSL